MNNKILVLGDRVDMQEFLFLCTKGSAVDVGVQFLDFEQNLRAIHDQELYLTALTTDCDGNAQRMWPLLLQQGKVVVVCVRLCSDAPNVLERVKTKWLPQIQTMPVNEQPRIIGDLPVIVVGLHDEMFTRPGRAGSLWSRQQRIAAALQRSSEFVKGYYECCTESGSGVDETLDHCAVLIGAGSNLKQDQEHEITKANRRRCVVS